MKIHVTDCIGCVWTIARVDVGTVVFVCCRADPEHTIVTFQLGIQFRDWLREVFAPYVVRGIVLRIVLERNCHPVLAQLYKEYVDALDGYQLSLSMGENQIASRYLVTTRKITEEIDRVEKIIAERNSHDVELRTELLAEWQKATRREKDGM